MPTRRLPQTSQSRFTAVQAGKDRKEALPAPPVIPYSAGTITRIDAFFAPYKAKMDAVDAALIVQGASTALVKTTRRQAELLILHFYAALQNAIARGLFVDSIRPGYGLDISDDTLPTVKSEADVTLWGGKINTGETARVAGGGAPVTFPSLAEVNTAVTNFKNANLQQANAKDLYDIAQEQLEVLEPEADKLILKMWNETETAFDEGNKPSMRRKCREWGVVYVPLAGETPSPDDFSITGIIADTQTGAPVSDVSVKVIETGEVFLSDGSGKYLTGVLNAGTYSLLLKKPGYPDTTVDSIEVVEGAITTRNISFGGTKIFEGDLNFNITTGFDAALLNAASGTMVTIELTTNMDLSAADTLAGGPGPVAWSLSMGTFTKTFDEFIALIGASELNHFIHIHNQSPGIGHYKITFSNLAP